MEKETKALDGNEGQTQGSNYLPRDSVKDQPQSVNNSGTTPPTTEKPNVPLESEESADVETQDTSLQEELTQEWKSKFEKWKTFLNDEEFYATFCKLAITDIEKSGLTPETVNDAGVKMYRRGKKGELKEILGFGSINGHSILATCHLIEFPYYLPSGKVLFRRFKLIPKLEDTSYIGPCKTPAVPYIMSSVWAVKSKTNIAIYITEGEKKTLKLLQHGRKAIGLSGVWNFKAGKFSEWKGERSLWNELQSFAWKGRRVYFAFDADLWVNPKVRMALYELGFKLIAMGADVRVSTWNVAYKGIDDYLAANPGEEERILNDFESEKTESSANSLLDFLRYEHRDEILRAIVVSNPDSLSLGTFKSAMKKAFGVTMKVIDEAIKDKEKQLAFEQRPEKDMTCQELKEMCELDYDPIMPGAFSIVNGQLTKIVIENNDIKAIPICRPFAITSIVMGEEVTMKVRTLNNREATVSISQSDRRQFDRDYSSLVMQPLSDDEITAMKKYVAEYHKVNESRIPKIISIKRTGWHEHDNKFYLPTVQSDGNVLWNGDHLSRAFVVRGDIAWQVELFRKTLKMPSGVISLSALAAPLLYLLDIENFLVKVSGVSSLGKSTSAAVAMGLYGSPKALKSSWRGTSLGREENSVVYTDMPCWIDEMETAGKDANKIIDFIYDYHLGVGRNASSLKGLRNRNEIRGVCLLTAEKDLDSIIESVRKERTATRGAYRRVVEVHSNSKYWTAFDRSIAMTDKKELAKINIQLARNHGYIGQQWIHLVNENVEHIREVYGRVYEELDTRALEGMESTYALMITVLEVLSDIGLISEEEHLKPMKKYILDLAERHGEKLAVTRDIATEAVEMLADFVISHRPKFQGLVDEEKRVDGVMGKVTTNKKDVFLLTSTLSDFCSAKGFVMSQLVESLYNKGRLTCSPDSKGRATYQKIDRLCGQSVRGYYIRDVFDPADLEDDEDDTE